MKTLLSRRLLLRRSGHLGAALALPAVACRDRDTSELPDPRTDSDADTDADTDTGTPLAPLTLSKEPWVSLLGAGAARLRLETREDSPARIQIQVSGSPTDVQATRSAAELTYTWAAEVEIDGVLPDEPGLHVIHEVLLADLPPGAAVSWSADLGGGQQRSGTFTADPGPGAAFTLGWLADTMYPNSADTLALLDAQGPDVVLHGGDIQYQSNPLDTWQGFFDAASPVTRQAPLLMCVGNHEDEDQDELEAMYDRLLGGQGTGTATRYFSFRYGGVAFLCLDSETSDLGTPGSAQWTWLAAELAAVDADDQLRHAVICMHRPVYTLSKHWPADTTVRDALHALCLQHSVPLVLAGHAHCYEHFLVDGVHYVVDGGGGALLYDPDEKIAVAEAARPGESALRLTARRAYGVTLLDFAAGGSITLRRLGTDGAILDTFTIEPAG